MGSIFKRGKVWYLDIRVNGSRIRKRVGSSQKIAEFALRDSEVKAARQEFGFAQKDITVEKFIKQYLDCSRANHSASDSEL